MSFQKLAGSEMRCLHTVTCTTDVPHSRPSDSDDTPSVELYCRTSTSQSWSSPGVCHRPRSSLPAETTSRVQRVGATPSRGVSWSRNPESTAGQQRGTEKADQSHHSSGSSSSSGTAGGVNGGGFPLTLTVSPSPDMMVPQPDLLARQCV